MKSGDTVGPYSIVEKLGEGGMGQVYRARDTRLDRPVAIKILPPALAADPIFRERFEREARTLSGLSHPNICTVHDVGRQDRTDYLVMEYLEGRTVADLLERGPMSPGDALRIAGQVADALIVAHRHGIVHRDLKPANVMIVRGTGVAGTAKLLDFGVAKRAAISATAVTGVRVPDVATRAQPLTRAGTILGTFDYMAPEQIEGREVDARADIWAFGCLLYEMLAGRRAFQAPTTAGLIAAILERQSAPIELPDPTLGHALNRVVAACLEKNPDERFQSMRDVQRELQWIPQTVAAPATVLQSRTRWPLLATIPLAGIVLIAATAFVMRRLEVVPHEPPPSMFSVGLDSTSYVVGQSASFGGAGSGTPAVSPDGRRVAFLAHNSADTSIWLRDLSKLEAQEVAGTTSARGLFWAPDGRSLGFFASGKLKTIDLATSRVEIVCDAPLAFGGTWAADGTILFSPEERSPIYKVNAQGGTPTAVTSLVAGRQQAHRWPQFLPDGRHFLYMPWTDGSTTREVTLGSLDGAAPRVLFESQSAAVLAGDLIVYVVDTPARLMARPFDTTSLQLSGTPFPLVPDNNVDYQWFTGEPNASAGGATLAYTTGKYRQNQLTWVNRAGRPLGTLGEAGVYFDPIASSDGAMLALERHDFGRGSGDIWTVDLARGAFSRLTSAPGYESTPVWSPDGRVAYASDQSTAPSLYVNTASGAGAESLLLTPPSRSFPLDWSSDGRYVVFMLNGGPTRNDIWTYDFQLRTAAPLLASTFNEGWARLSPDGHWIAYVSDESAQREVYVRSFPAGAVKVQISTSGGGQPQWRRDGKELFYMAPDNTIMSVDIRPAANRVDASKPQSLFTANVDQNKSIRNQYAASPDGERFLILSLVDRNRPPIVAVLNWRALLRQ